MDRKKIRIGIFTGIKTIYLISLLFIFVFYVMVNNLYPHYFLYREPTEEVVVKYEGEPYLDCKNPHPTIEETVTGKYPLTVKRFFFQTCRVENLPYGKENMWIMKNKYFAFVFKNYNMILLLLFLYVAIEEAYDLKYRRNKSFIYGWYQRIKYLEVNVKK